MNTEKSKSEINPISSSLLRGPFGARSRAGAASYGIKLIIGLGNPDEKYQNTYHNVGFLAIDYLAKKPPNSNLQITNYKLLKSAVYYMNESGKFVAKSIRKYGVKPEQLLIVHDDSDIELGKYKIQFGRGSAGHKGIESIIKSLKTKDFWRLRVGIRPSADKPRYQSTPTKDKIPAGQEARHWARRGTTGGPTRRKAGEFVLKKITARDKKIFFQTFKTLVNSI